MGNGGNCELCEWFDVYSLDGNFVGSTRYRKKSSTMLDSAIGALYDKSAKRVLNHQSLSGFYEGSAVK
jgi:hypothetical protein